MDHLLGSVQQSTESSRKFVIDALSGVRKELKSIKGKQSAHNNNGSNPAPVQHVMLSEDISVPAQSQRHKETPLRPCCRSRTGNGQNEGGPLRP